MIHAAKIKVDEQGIIAAAPTYSCYISWYVDQESATKFHCARPFIFTIHKESRNQILFREIYRGPLLI